MKTIYKSIKISFFLLILSNFLACKTKAQNINSTQSKSITLILQENNHESISKRIALYNDFKKKNPTQHLEEEMNLYGYTLLWEGKVKESIEIFKLLVQEYPESANTYDSLAESYLADGNKDQALVYYTKAFEMDSNNFNAEDQIDKIKFPNKKRLAPNEKFDIQYSLKEYEEDLDQLLKTLIKVHPNALKFISKDALSNIVNNKKSLLTENTTYAEFVWHCSEIIANINCSHTGSGNFYPENDMLPMHLRFPLQTRLIGNQLFVIDPLNNKSIISVKDQILSINGIEVANIIQDIYRHIPSQGFIETSKRHDFNRWSTGMIAYALGFPEKYEVQVKSNSQPITLKPTSEHFDPMRDQSKIYCGDDLCLEYLDTEKKIAVLTISSFNYYEWNNYKEFERFIDETMRDLKTHGTSQLIIDVRGNGGGSPESSIHLLRYLIDEPFVYLSKAEFEGKTELIPGEKLQLPHNNIYKGNLLFLIDGEGNSTTGHFMSIVKERNLGVIIGEELGSNQFCSGGQKACRLRNTKLTFYVANNTHISTANSLPDETGILPDFNISQSIHDYLLAKDPVKQFAIDRIAQEINWQPASKYHSSYFLEAELSWDKELFRIPLNFAPQITLRGIEDARFPKGWNEKDNSYFWSYVFAWNVDHPQLLTTEEMSDNLELYFNGLMNIEKRGEEVGISKSVGHFNVTKTEHGITSYLGEIKTLDGFFTKQPLTFNVLAEQQYCEEAKRAIVIFRFSPQEFTSDVWNTLKTVTFPDTICEK